MAFLFNVLWKVVYYGVTIGYPAYKAHESVKAGRVERLWIVYFLIMGLLSLLQYTLLYPIVLILDLVSSCLFSIVKLVFAFWLVHQDYRGALLLEQIGRPYMHMAYGIVQPAVGKVLALVGVPNREDSKN